MFDLTGRAALITGSSRGIGRAIALQLARQGASIAVNYLSNEDAAKEVQATIRSYEGQAVLLQGDISMPEQTERVVNMAHEAFGRLDILVNNAGFNRDTLLLRMSVQDWDEVMATNLRATFLCTKAAVRHMLRQRWGRIINIGSVVGIRGNIGQVNYSASKAAIIGFTKALAKEVATRNITVNTVTPGYIRTDTVEVLPQETKDRIMTWIPQGHFGEVDDVAHLVAFIAGKKAKYMTGQIVSVDGGMAI